MRYFTGEKPASFCVHRLVRRAGVGAFGPSTGLQAVQRRRLLPAEVAVFVWCQRCSVTLVGWVARMESQRRSERTEAGMDWARQNGVRLGRPKRAKDKRKRRRPGYHARYS